MITIVSGDILKSKAQTLVNTVNCVGVMGKGIALEFKKIFPDMYEDYVRRCKSREVKLGRPYLYKRLLPPWILNFPTKDDWRSVARLEDIIRGLENVEKHYKEWGITSLAVPPLGCGHGQLEWRVVGPTLYRYLSRLEVPVELYAPFGTPHEELQPEYLETHSIESSTGLPPAPASKIPPAWVALVEILDRIEREPYHWPIGRTTFQKLVYFATQEGIPTGLEYRQASYGPFAPALKRLITQLVNNGLIQEERLGRMLAIKVGPTFRDARRAFKTHLVGWNDAIEKLTDLFLRMPTPRAELAATVHYAANIIARGTKEKPSETDVLAEVMRWKERRRPPLREQDVAQMIRTLAMIGWLDLNPSSDLPVSEETLLGV